MVDWIGKNWVLLVCAVVALIGIGVGVMALLGFEQVQARANEVATIAGQLDGMTGTPANLTMIEEARKHATRLNDGVERARKMVLRENERKPLRDDVFPVPQTTDAPYRFRTAYQDEMRKLPELLRARPATSGEMVNQVQAQLQEKAQKENKLLALAQTLRVPKPPAVQPVIPTTPLGPDIRGGGRGEDPMRSVGRGEDPMRGRDRGEDPMRAPDPGQMGMMFPRPGVPLMPNLPLRPGSAAQPVVAAENPQVLAEKAKNLAIYETARRAWMYVDSMSFHVHLIAESVWVGTPPAADLWGAQMSYWINRDVAEALKRVNEQAAQALPEDQRWVANLPVKHLVSIRIGDYVTGGATDETGRTHSLSVLSRGGGYVAVGRPGGATVVPLTSSAGAAFTGRSRNEQFDVVHYEVQVVVDARAAPKVLNELGRQNLTTPLLVQYRNVNDIEARESGYLYGTDPVIAMTVLCEALFFRSIYEPMMPEEVKKILSGQGVVEEVGRGGGRGGGRDGGDMRGPPGF